MTPWAATARSPAWCRRSLRRRTIRLDSRAISRPDQPTGLVLLSSERPRRLFSPALLARTAGRQSRIPPIPRRSTVRSARKPNDCLSNFVFISFAVSSFPLMVDAARSFDRILLCHRSDPFFGRLSTWILRLRRTTITQDGNSVFLVGRRRRRYQKEFAELRNSELETAGALALKETAMARYNYIYERRRGIFPVDGMLNGTDSRATHDRGGAVA